MASDGRKVRDAGAGSKRPPRNGPGNVGGARHAPERLLLLAQRIASGQRVVQIVSELSKLWNVAPRTVYKYRERVLLEMADLIPDQRRQLEEILALERFEDLYVKCLKAGDFRTAMHVTKNRALVAGVIGPLRVKHEHEFPGGIPVTVDAAEQMTDEQARKVLERAARAAELAKQSVAPATNGHGAGQPPNGSNGAGGGA